MGAACDRDGIEMCQVHPGALRLGAALGYSPTDEDPTQTYLLATSPIPPPAPGIAATFPQPNPSMRSSRPIGERPRMLPQCRAACPAFAPRGHPTPASTQKSAERYTYCASSEAVGCLGLPHPHCDMLELHHPQAPSASASPARIGGFCTVSAT